MAARPNEILTGIDCRNAFGEAHRAPACRIAAQHCPTFARLLHNLWEGTQLHVHVPEGPGVARPLLVCDGFVQGGCEAAPAFALTLREAISQFQEEAAVAGRPCRLWAYMDDLYIQCSVDHWKPLMDLLTTRLAAVGLTCQPAKSHCYVPAWTPEQIASEASRFAEYATLRSDGLPVLGTVAEGQFALTLCSSWQPDHATIARLDKATALSDLLNKLCVAPTTGPRRHPAWRILDSVINQCLTYDASVNDPSAMALYGERLDKLVVSTAANILSVPGFSDREICQLRLDRSAGGCGLRSAQERCATAFLAAVLRLGSSLSERCPNALLQADLVAQGKWAQECLKDWGIILDRHGMPHTADAAPAVELDLALHLEQAMPKRQRAWWTKIDAHRAAQLRATGGLAAVRRLNGCGGPEGGAYLRATRPEMGSSLTDNEFVIATRFRLGMRVMASGICHHQKANSQAPRHATCNTAADPFGEHAIICKCGGAPYCAHSQGANILLEASRKAGYQSRREQVVPELATPDCAAPQLDVEGWSTLGLPRLLIDFSIRHPHACHYSSGQSATLVAGREKASHYGSRQGLVVRTAAMETYGKHGDDLTALLEQLADLARQRELAYGLPPTRWLRRWRAQLSCAVTRLVGRAVQSACAPGTSIC